MQMWSDGAAVNSRTKTGVPPGPFPLEAIRQYAGGSFAQAPHYLLRYAQRYGPIWSFNLLSRRVYVLDDADAIRSVLVEHQHLFRKSRVQRLKPVLGEGLVTSENAVHVRQRRLMQPSFHRSRLPGYADLITAEVHRTIDTWHDGESIDIIAEMMRLALTIVGATLFGTDVTSETKTVRAAVEELVEVWPKELAFWNDLKNRVLPFRRRPLESIGKRLDESLMRIISGRKPNDGGEDLLTTLLAAQDEHGNTMTAQQLRDEAITILITGHETAASALTWMLALVGFHTQVRERIEAEVAEVVGSGTPRFEHIPKLRYTAAVFEETLRLYPPIWAFGRRATGDLELLGYRVPRGSTVVVSPYVTHRNPRYFDNPLEFTPDRWLTTEPPPKVAYFPFGAGARGCIGEQLARLEGVLALATIVGRVRLIPTTTAALPDVAPQLMLRPTHLSMTPLHRSKHRASVAVEA